MKKILVLFFFTIATSNFGQITFENYYPTGNSYKGYLRAVKLSSAGYKYVINDTNTIILYNLNHTVYQTINIPSYSPQYNGVPQILYVSDELFNTNPNDIEYFVYYSDIAGHNNCRVYDQAGNTLFTKDSILLGYYDFHGYENFENFVTYTSSGLKMFIPNQYGVGSSVYSLPGNLPCSDCINGTTSNRININETPKSGSIANYPNPTAGQTTIEYTLPQGVTNGDVVFYNISGQEIKRLKVSNAFKDVLISTSDLEAGTYYYKILTLSGFSAGKKMIVIK